MLIDYKVVVWSQWCRVTKPHYMMHGSMGVDSTYIMQMKMTLLQCQIKGYWSVLLVCEEKLERPQSCALVNQSIIINIGVWL